MKGVRRTTNTSLAAALAVAISGIFPMFLFGAMSVQMMAELSFTNSELGYGVGVFFVTGASTSIFLGRVVQRIGPGNGMRLAALLSGGSLLGTATLAHGWPAVAGFLAVGGLGIAVAQPAANMTILRHAPPSRHGLVVGLKQAALPTAALLAGAAVPTVALTVGWRWAFIGASALPALVLLLAPIDRQEHAAEPRPEELGRDRAVVLSVVALGALLGSMASNSAGTFLVLSLVESGTAEATAGTVLAVSGAAGIIARIVLGLWADRANRRLLTTSAVMLFGGSAGFLMLTGSNLGLSIVASLLAFGLGWGWPGLVHLAVMLSHRSGAATATGILQTGGLVGGGFGPVLFGVVATSFSFAAAWVVTACLATAGGIMLMLSQPALDRVTVSGDGPKRLPSV